MREKRVDRGTDYAEDRTGGRGLESHLRIYVIDSARKSSGMVKPECSKVLMRFGAFEVDLASGELRKQGTRLRLQEQPFKVLAALLDRPGQLVPREELVRQLWPDGTFVDFDRGLNAAVTRLRQALNDSADTPRYVETVARRGYRFLAPVEEVDRSSPVPVALAPRRAAQLNWWIWSCAAC